MLNDQYATDHQMKMVRRARSHDFASWASGDGTTAFVEIPWTRIQDGKIEYGLHTFSATTIREMNRHLGY